MHAKNDAFASAFQPLYSGMYSKIPSCISGPVFESHTSTDQKIMGTQIMCCKLVKLEYATIPYNLL